MSNIDEAQKLLRKIRRNNKSKLSNDEIEILSFAINRLDQIKKEKRFDPIKVSTLLLLVARVLRPLVEHLLE